MVDKIIYVAVLEDRHTDDWIEVFESFDDAKSFVTDRQEEYGDDYVLQWHEETIPGLLFYVCTNSLDGPSIRIEQKMLK